MGILTWIKHSLVILTHYSVQLYACNVNYTMLIGLRAVATHLAITWKFVACRVVQASPLQTIQRVLRGGRKTLCISCGFGRRLVSETRRALMVTQFTLTLNANNLFLSREPSGRALKLNLPFLYPCFSTCHPQHYCCTTSWFPKVRGGPRFITVIMMLTFSALVKTQKLFMFPPQYISYSWSCWIFSDLRRLTLSQKWQNQL